jgi:hypothetical protein
VDFRDFSRDTEIAKQMILMIWIFFALSIVKSFEPQSSQRTQRNSWLKSALRLGWFSSRPSRIFFALFAV